MRVTSPNFWENVEKQADCWIWRGYIDQYGYGIFTQKPHVRAHRYAYQELIGGIPDSLVLDHNCHNRDDKCAGGNNCQHRRCVNPAHLSATTNKKNVLSGKGLTAVHAAKTHCIRGHEFTPENTILGTKRSPAHRACRICGRVKSLAYYHRRKAKI